MYRHFTLSVQSNAGAAVNTAGSVWWTASEPRASARTVTRETAVSTVRTLTTVLYV